MTIIVARIYRHVQGIAKLLKTKLFIDHKSSRYASQSIVPRRFVAEELFDI